MLDKFKNFDLFIFDLDDTLYPEKDYLFKAYDQIGFVLSRNLNLDSFAISAFLKNTFLLEGREKLFDKFLKKYEKDPKYLSVMIETLRQTVIPEKINLYPMMYELLSEIIKLNKKVFVLTNGNPGQQRNKVKSINWFNLDSAIKFIYANEYEPKPSSFSVKMILSLEKVEISKVIFIGNSENDRLCASSAGIDYHDVIIKFN
jgi:FMN phosphatase YigB (HAD superfamily)